jgi:hypothetical protein
VIALSTTSMSCCSSDVWTNAANHSSSLLDVTAGGELAVTGSRCWG